MGRKSPKAKRYVAVHGWPCTIWRTAGGNRTMAKGIFGMVSYRIKKVIAWILTAVILALMGFGGYYLIVEVL